MADAGSLASGREAIEKRYATHFASSPSKSSLKLVQVYAIGKEVCAISERSHGFRFGKGYLATIYVREADDWKIRIGLLQLIDKDRHIGKATWPSGTLTTGSAQALSELATTIASCLALDVALPGLSGLDPQKRVIIPCDVFSTKDLDP